jgi:hypothetical protein
MVTALIISGLIIVLLTGLILTFRRHSKILKDLDFAREYREKFVEFVNHYFKNNDRWSNKGNIDGENYVWLTMNVNKIQNKVGGFGIMTYKPAYQNYMINNYQLIVNTLPLFREGKVENFDANSVDDCLLRYLGHLENNTQETFKNLKNPIIWFREGIREILSIPILLLSWFGIFSTRTVNRIIDSTFFKIIAGLFALVTFISGVVTIIVGYEETLAFFQRFLIK